MAPASLFHKHPGGWYVAHNATITADVAIGTDASFWFGSVVRGDVAPVRIGAMTNVQDGAVIHCDAGIPNEVGEGVTIGHAAVVHGRRVGDGALIGMGATLLGRTVIGEEALVAAGAVVPPGMEVASRTLVAGVPAKFVRELTEPDLAYLRRLPPHYVKLAQRYAAGEQDVGGYPLTDAPPLG